MPDEKYYRGALVADIVRLAALNDDLTCDRHHPHNAAYLTPLADAEDEHMANEMASIIFSAIAADHGDEPDFDEEKVFEQALIDSRRMLRERRYARLFGGDAPQSLDEIIRERRGWA